MSNDLATQMTEKLHSIVPVLAKLQIQVVESRPGHAAAELPLAPNTNHLGITYAGSLFCLAECLGGAIAFSTFPDEYVPIAKTLEIDYRRPGTSTIRATATLAGDEVHKIRNEARDNGKSDFILTSDLTDADGVLVARTRGVYQIRRIDSWSMRTSDNGHLSSAEHHSDQVRNSEQ